MLEEWKSFISRGNFIDLATGMVVGASFSQIVSAFTSDLLMPILGLLVGKLDFSSYYLNLSSVEYASLAAAKEAGAPVIAYGSFINTCLDFLIVATAIFVLIKQVNRLLPKAPEPKAPRTCPYCKETVADEATKCPHCASDIAGK
ncbi:MAG: large conductance mechanosensitive channel protein MscL [Selenomonadaceae bacterium]|nr:large conductance mechanosensitive channel protein MscL [Selenomonadaceae bacterium]